MPRTVAGYERLDAEDRWEVPAKPYLTRVYVQHHNTQFVLKTGTFRDLGGTPDTT